MGNFFRRVFAFLLGMVFAVVLMLGGTAGFGYWAFKNMTLKDMGAEQEGLGELNGLTIEEWVALYTEAQNNPQSFTFKALEDYGFSTDEFIKTLGVDVEKADQEDLELLREIAPLMLLSGDTTNLPMATLFAFMPKDENGKYPLFSKHAREILREKPLSILTEVDKKTNKPLIYSYINDLSIGAILSQNYEEVRDNATATYTYTSSEKRFELFGNVKISIITDCLESGKVFDFGLEVNGGKLNDIGLMEAKEFLATLLTNTEEEFIGMCNSLNALSGTTVAGLFVFNEENNAYEFNVETILTNLNIGKFMGYVKCTEDENCLVDHKDGSTHDGKWYVEKGNGIEDEIYVGEGISEDIMKNLFEVNLSKIIEGISDITFLIDGVYLGKALGYSISTNPPNLDDYCNLECNLKETNEEHEHVYYWVDNNDKYVGDMFNTLSNNTLQKLFTSGIDVESIFSSTNIGGLLGYTKCTGDSSSCQVNHTLENPCGSGQWFDNDGNLVDKGDIMGSIMSKLYDKKISELSSISLSELLQDNYLGDLMGFKKIANSGYCNIDCNLHLTDNTHKHEYYWVDASNQFIGQVQNALCNISIKSLLDGEKISVQGVLADSKIGELMEFKFVNGEWQKQNGEPAVSNDNVGKILNKIYSKTINDIANGTVSQGLFEGMYFGDFLGYVYDESKSQWVDKDGLFVGKLYNEISKISVETAMTGGGINLENIVDTLQLGEIFGYLYCDGSGVECPVHDGNTCNEGWYDENGNKVVGDDTIHRILLNIYGNNLSELKNNQIDISNIVGGIYLGEFLGYTKNEYDEWVDGENNKLSLLNDTLANVLVSDLIDGSVDITSVVGDFYVGEFMGYKLVNNTWYNAENEPITKLENLIANKKLSQIINGEFNILSEIDELQLQDVISISDDNYLFSNLKEVKIKELSQKLETLTLKDVVDVSNSSTLLNSLKDVKISELSQKIETLTLKDVVEIPNENYLLNSLKDTKISELSQKIETLKLKDVIEISEGNYLLNSLKDVKLSEFTSKIETLTLKDVIEISGDNYLLNSLKDVKINELSSKLETLTLKDVIKIEESDYLLNNLKDVKLSELSQKMSTLKLKDVIDTESQSTPQILKLLSGVEINDLGSEMNTLQIGQICGYELRGNGKWYKGDNLVDGINQKIASYTLSYISENGINTSDITLGDVFNNIEEGSMFALIYTGNSADSGFKMAYTNKEDVPLSEIAPRISYGVKNASVGELMECGVIDITSENQSTLTKMYTLEYGLNAEEHWKSLTMNELINDILETIKAYVE